MTFLDASKERADATNVRLNLNGLRHAAYATLGAVLAGAAITPFVLLALAISQGIVVI